MRDRGRSRIPGQARLPGSEDLDSLLEDIRRWAARHESVIGLAIYGSVARGKADPYSDLDLIVIVSSPEALPRTEQELVQRCKPVFEFKKNGRRVLFLANPFLKVELTVTTETGLRAVRHLFVGSRIRDPSRAILVDKVGRLARTLVSRSAGHPDDSADAFEREGCSFLYYYNSFHAPFARGDLYRAFFQYCLAYFKLMTLAHVASGGMDYLYAPSFLLHSLEREDAARLRCVSPVLDALKMREGKEEMFDFFLELVKRTGEEDAFPLKGIEGLREAIAGSHPRFFRLRDLGKLQGVRPGVLYRAARLDRYSSEELLSWFHEVDLRTLVDLRTDQEMSERAYGYPSKVLERVAYVRLPVSTVLSKLASTAAVDNPMARFYTELPNEPSFQDALRMVVAILADPKRCPLTIHCRGGSDRTGMLVALVLLAIGVDKGAVVGDYLMSYGHTKADYINRTFESVNRSGSVENYLQEAGVTLAQLDALRGNLVDL